GVFWEKSRNKWLVKVGFGGKDHYVGRFDEEEEAAMAYNEKARELFGEDCYQNIIGLNNQSVERIEIRDKAHQRRVNNPSGYKGVSYSKARGKWIGYIS